MSLWKTDCTTLTLPLRVTAHSSVMSGFLVTQYRQFRAPLSSRVATSDQAVKSGKYFFFSIHVCKNHSIGCGVNFSSASVPQPHSPLASSTSGFTTVFDMVISVMPFSLHCIMRCSRVYQYEVQHWFIIEHHSTLSLVDTITLSPFLFALLVCKSCQLFLGTSCTYLILYLSGVTSESSWTDDPQWWTTNNGSCSSTGCTNHTSCNTEWSSSSTNSGCACLKFAGQ